jgi:uncharacterized coiled-coil DUF342 family protein
MKKKLSKKQEKELIKKYGHIPTQKEIFEKMKASQEKLIYSLAGALASAPDDSETREELQKAIDKAFKLREGIYKMMGEEPPEIKLDTKILDQLAKENPIPNVD